jgi:uncharacterized membrane protein YsdA (DUF1294 family)
MDTTLLLLLVLYLVVSAVTFFVYGYDKKVAQANRAIRRIPEARLHLLELIGGWPGALIGQTFWRHKTSQEKLTFRVITWAIAFLHICVWLVVYFVFNAT